MRAHLVRLAGNAIVYGIGQILSRFVGFLLLPLFTRELSPTDYGITALLAVLAMFASSLFALGFGASMGLVYFETELPERRAETVWTALAVLGASALALLVGGTAGSTLIADALFASTSSYDLPRLVTITVATTAVGLLITPFLLYLQFESRPRAFVAITLTTTAISSTLAVGAVVVLKLGVPGLLTANLIGQIAGLVLAALPAVRELRVRIRIGTARELLRLGLPIVPGFAFLFVMQQANKFILQLDAGLDEVGVYSVGFNLGLFMSLLVGSFTTAWYPFFQSFMTRPSEGQATFARVMTYYVVAFGLVDIAFFAGARAVVTIMTDTAFHDASAVVGFSAASQYAVGMSSILLVGMYLAKEVKYIALLQGLAAVVSISAAVTLVAPFGAFGAAVALLIGHAAMVLIQAIWNRSRHYLPIDYERRRIALFLGLHVVAATVSLWPRNLPLGAEIVLAVSIVGLSVLGTTALLTAGERRVLADAVASVRARLGQGVP